MKLEDGYLIVCWQKLPVNSKFVDCYLLLGQCRKFHKSSFFTHFIELMPGPEAHSKVRLWVCCLFFYFCNCVVNRIDSTYSFKSKEPKDKLQVVYPWFFKIASFSSFWLRDIYSLIMQATCCAVTLHCSLATEYCFSITDICSVTNSHCQPRLAWLASQLAASKVSISFHCACLTYNQGQFITTAFTIDATIPRTPNLNI